MSQHRNNVIVIDVEDSDEYDDDVDILVDIDDYGESPDTDTIEEENEAIQELLAESGSFKRPKPQATDEAELILNQDNNQICQLFLGDTIEEENETMQEPLSESGSFKRPKPQATDKELDEYDDDVDSLLGYIEDYGESPDTDLDEYDDDVDSLLGYIEDYGESPDTELDEYDDDVDSQLGDIDDYGESPDTDLDEYDDDVDSQLGDIDDYGESPDTAPTLHIEDSLQKGLQEEAEAELTVGVTKMSFAGQAEAKVGFEVKEPPKVNVQESLIPAGAASPDRRGSMPKVSSSSDLILTPYIQDSKTKPLDIDVAKVYLKRHQGKEVLNMVVIGHVDAGKSTLMGHFLYQLGQVDEQQMQKYKMESQDQDKPSHAYAWVLDETKEERRRGFTMDIGLTPFETEHHMVTLLDAPGHKDFITNMIRATAQADVAILVVDATRGEFETGFESGGQTREHAILARSLGVRQMAVAVNKMDTVDWSKDRFNEIVGKLKPFLDKIGYKDSDIDYIPCSGLDGENLVEKAKTLLFKQWYKGPCLLEQIDVFRSPSRPLAKSFRMSVSDVYKEDEGAEISICGNIESGRIILYQKIVAMPAEKVCIVKGISIHDEEALWACAGDQVILDITGNDEMKVDVGSVLSSLINPMRTTTRFQAWIDVFDVAVPITKGLTVLLYCQALCTPAVIKKLVSTLHDKTGGGLKQKPKCLPKNSFAIVEIETERPICIELYKDHKDLGRFVLRYSGATIAAGLVTLI